MQAQPLLTGLHIITTDQKVCRLYILSVLSSHLQETKNTCYVLIKSIFITAGCIDDLTIPICKIKNYNYLCTPIKRSVQNDKDYFS